MFDIYAKASLTIDQIAAKLQIGCDGIEVQLLGELIKDLSTCNFYTVDEVFKLEEFLHAKIRAVHTPLLLGQRELLLEQACDRHNAPLLKSCFEIAHYFGSDEGPCYLIIHTETFYDLLAGIPSLWRTIVDVLRRLLRIYDRTYLLVENVSPIRSLQYNGRIHLSNNCWGDNVEIVERLREETGINRIGTCLDTCHAMMSRKYMQAIYKEMMVPCPDFSLDYFFSINRGLCKLIHLADMRNSGIGKDEHGQPFDPAIEDSVGRLVDILWLYKTYEYSCPITIEVREDDYMLNANYRKTRELVLSLKDIGN